MISNISYNCTYTVKDSSITSTIAYNGIMWFLLIGFPLVVIFGIIGNIFSFVILKESALKNVGHFYLLCLSIFDSLTLITILYSFYYKIVLYPMLIQMNMYSPFLYSITKGYGFGTFRLYTSFTMRLISIWTIVIFSFDRLIAISFPLQSQKISTVRNAGIVIAALVVISFFVNIPWIFSIDKVYNPCFKIMLGKSSKVSSVMLLIESIFLTIIPSILICLCNISIIVLIKKRQRHSTLTNKKEIMNQERIVTVQLLLVSSAFVLLTFPNFIITSIIFEHKHRKDFSYKSGHKANALHIGVFLFTINLSINFILYCLTGPNFRKAAWNMLRCKYEEMRFYRKIILNPHVTTDSNFSEITDTNCRKNSVVSLKNNLLLSSKCPIKKEIDNEQLGISKIPPNTPLIKYARDTLI